MFAGFVVVGAVTVRLSEGADAMADPGGLVPALVAVACVLTGVPVATFAVFVGVAIFDVSTVGVAVAAVFVVAVALITAVGVVVGALAVAVVEVAVDLWATTFTIPTPMSPSTTTAASAMPAIIGAFRCCGGSPAVLPQLPFVLACGGRLCAPLPVFVPTGAF